MFLLLLSQLAVGFAIAISIVFWFTGALLWWEVFDEKRLEWKRDRSDRRMFRQIEEYRNDFS